jgi:hypothetical protein
VIRWDRRPAIGGLVVPDRQRWRAGRQVVGVRRRAARAVVASAPTAAAPAAIAEHAADDLAVIALAWPTEAPLPGAAIAVFAPARLTGLAPVAGLAAIAAASPVLTITLGALAAGFQFVRLAGRIEVRATDHWVSIQRRPDRHEARVARSEVVDVWSRPGQIYLRVTGARGIALVDGRAPDARDRRRARHLALRLGVPFVDDASELPTARAVFVSPA